MIHQLRIYEIFDKNKDAFHSRFRDHAARLMRAPGFRILDIWETRTEERPQFVYLLEWPDETTKERAWKAFMADQEWNALKRETSARDGVMVGAIEDRTLRRVAYSPAADG